MASKSENAGRFSELKKEPRNTKGPNLKTMAIRRINILDYLRNSELDETYRDYHRRKRNKNK